MSDIDNPRIRIPVEVSGFDMGGEPEEPYYKDNVEWWGRYFMMQTVNWYSRINKEVKTLSVLVNRRKNGRVARCPGR